MEKKYILISPARGLAFFPYIAVINERINQTVLLAFKESFPVMHRILLAHHSYANQAKVAYLNI